MVNGKEVIKLKREIEKKQEELNNIVLKQIDKNEILKFSQELDVLIADYLFQMLKTNNEK